MHWVSGCPSPGGHRQAPIRGARAVEVAVITEKVIVTICHNCDNLSPPPHPPTPPALHLRLRCARWRWRPAPPLSIPVTPFSRCSPPGGRSRQRNAWPKRWPWKAQYCRTHSTICHYCYISDNLSHFRFSCNCDNLCIAS